jgi:hypothetical protein
VRHTPGINGRWKCLTLKRGAAAETIGDNDTRVEPLVLQGPGEPVLLLGHLKPPVTYATYNVLGALLNAGPRGLTKDKLDEKSGHTDARKYLKALIKKDPDWKKVISCPEISWRHYRIIIPTTP